MLAISNDTDIYNRLEGPQFNVELTIVFPGMDDLLQGQLGCFS